MARKTPPEAEAVYKLAQAAYLDAVQEKTTAYAIAKARADASVEEKFLRVGGLMHQALKQPGATRAALIDAVGLSGPTVDKYVRQYRASVEGQVEETVEVTESTITYSVETEGNIKVIYAQRGDEAVRIDTDKTYYSPEGPLGRAMAAKCPEWLTLEEHYRAQEETGLKIDGLPEQE